MDAPDRRLSQLLADPKLLKRLAVYAQKRYIAYAQLEVAPLVESSDLVNQAIMQTLSGERPWNPQSTPELFVHLAGCIKSILSNAASRKEYELTTDQEVESIPDKTVGELQLLLASTIDNLLVFINSHAPDLTPFVLAMIKRDIIERQELAHFFSIDVKQVDNNKARLKRLYNKYLEQAG